MESFLQHSLPLGDLQISNGFERAGGKDEKKRSCCYLGVMEEKMENILEELGDIWQIGQEPHEAWRLQVYF